MRAHSPDNSILSFSSCRLRNNSVIGQGGAVHSILATVKATETVFTQNTASNGGAIALLATSQSTFTDCKFDGNAAAFDGGAILSLSSLTLMEGCEFSGNRARDDGGAMYTSRGSSIFRNCDFTENSATLFSSANGGAIYMWNSDSIFEYCSFNRNSARNDGGAVALRTSTSSIENCDFTGNDAGDDGGALFTRLGSEVAVKNCFFEENTTGDDGGAIYTITTQSLLEENHFVKNSAGVDGGAIHVSNDCTTVMEKCLFDSNNANTDGGAISLRDNCSLNGCRFDGNSAFLGGAILSRSTATLTTDNCDFTDNAAFAGGGIVSEGFSDLTDSRFEGNSASVGGAIFAGSLEFSSTVPAETTISGRTLFQCNSASSDFGGGGGAVLSRLGRLSMTDAEIIGNSAGESGGGIYLGINSTSSFERCLFEQNIAGSVGGGAIASGEFGPLATLTMNATVFHGNDVDFSGASSDDIFDFSLPSNSIFECGSGYGNCFCDADANSTIVPNITTNDLPTICSGAGVGQTCDQSCASSIRPVCNEPASLPAITSGITSRFGDANAQNINVWDMLQKGVDDDEDGDEDDGEDARKYDERMKEMDMGQ